MKKKFIVLCTFIVALSICVTMFGVPNVAVKNDTTTATMKNHSAPKAETPGCNAWGDIVGDVIGDIGSGSTGDIGGLLGGVDTSGLGDTIGGFGDSFGGIGDALGGIAGGMGDTLGGIFGGGFGGSG